MGPNDTYNSSETAAGLRIGAVKVAKRVRNVNEIIVFSVYLCHDNNLVDSIISMISWPSTFCNKVLIIYEKKNRELIQ